MIIGGLQRISLIDYPGKISAVVFTQGCNFRCPYCHNAELVDPAQYGPLIPEEEIFTFLEKRRGKLDAVNVTGGEPTLQADLERFLLTTREMGFLIKVDTNGSQPDVLEKLIRKGLVDYLAMDLKGPLTTYSRIAYPKNSIPAVSKSIDLITASGIEHEFRTTVVRSQLSPEDLLSMAKMLKSTDRYVLQTFIHAKTLDPSFLSERPYSPEEFTAIRERLKEEHRRVIIR
jgi:pyruvate formate lyase activating enzyme